MENEEKINADYLKSFNQGYIFNQLEPELATQISKGLGNTERAEGFRAGMGQWEINKEELLKTGDVREMFSDNTIEVTQSAASKTYVPRWLKEDRSQNIQPSAPEHDKDTL